jgi:hypothetical protein
MRRFTIFLLTLSLILCNSIFFVNAVSYPDIVNPTINAAVDYLSDQGIVSGYPDGTYKPTNPIVRAEVAALIIKAYAQLDYSITRTQFSDANNHWAMAYIGTISKLGLVSGYPDGTFKPDRQVSYAELFTILINSMGLKSQLDNSLNWPLNYTKLAGERGLTVGLSTTNWNSLANRGDVAIALYNSLMQGREDISITRGTAKTFRYNAENEIVYTTEFYKNINDTARIEVSIEHEMLDEDANIVLTTQMTAGIVTFKTVSQNVVIKKEVAKSTVILDVSMSGLEKYNDNEYTLSISYNKSELAKCKIRVSTDYSYEKGIVERAVVNNLKFFLANDWVAKDQRYYSIEVTPIPSAMYVWFELDAKFPLVTDYVRLPISFEYTLGGRLFGKHTYDYYLAPNDPSPDITGAIYTTKYVDWREGTYHVKVTIYDKVMAEGDFKVTRD